MYKWTQRRLLSMALCLLIHFTGLPDDTGSLSGRVSTESGQPLVAASVYLQAGGPSPGRPPMTKTDQNGSYYIGHVPSGTYVIHAFKLEEGYPDTVFAFNLAPNQKLREVTIAAGQQLKNVEIRLGPKSGTLAFSVVDRRTEAPLTIVNYKLCQVQHPTWCLNTTSAGEAQFLVPSTEITVGISAKGYRSIKYRETGRQYIKVAPGGQKRITLVLEPLK